ncbi:MAG: phosphatidate cytidylyltransferase [Christensenellales bacterium]|jgi:phosphatidate cytidylyltransferase
MSSNIKRLLTGIVLLTVMVFAVIYVPVFYAVCLVAMLLGQYEMGFALRKNGYKIAWPILAAFSLSLLPAVVWLPIWALPLAFMLAVACILFLPVLSEKFTLQDVMANCFILCYPTMSIILWLIINTLGGALRVNMMVCIFLFSCVNDAFAFYTGSLFGKHKLAERISPKKTVEGVIGGWLATVAVASIYYLFIRAHMPQIDILHYLIMATIAGIVTPLGDLAASSIKRSLDIKDFGHLFPGHGGVLDRIDGILINTVAVCVYFLLLTNWV